MVVLGKFPGQLGEFQRYLQRRDWSVSATSDLKRLLTEITLSKPQVALISVNVQHSNFQKLQSILERVYRLKVFYYIEEYSEEYWQKMLDIDAPAENKIFGQLTGPAFERALAKQTARATYETSVTVPSPKESLNLVLKTGLANACKTIFNNHAPENQEMQKLAWVQSVSCIYFENSVLSGHFVVAAADDHHVDTYLMEALRGALKRLYEISNVPLTQEDLYQMKVRKVEFRSWSSQESSFLESAIHNGVEIMVAFFPMDAERMQLESGQDDMLAIDLDEIQAGRKMDFELYLHLPLNGKFIMYVSKGSFMELQQQLNLQTRGIRKLHVKKADAPFVLRSRSTQYFDRSILNFYENKAVA